jgi:hypothetical protein
MPASSDSEDDCGEADGMQIGRGNRSSQRKPVPAPLSSITKSHMTRPRLNPGRRSGKPATNCLSYGVAIWKSVILTVFFFLEFYIKLTVTGFSSFVHHPVFWKPNLFPSSGEGETTTLLGPLERADPVTLSVIHHQNTFRIYFILNSCNIKVSLYILIVHIIKRNINTLILVFKVCILLCILNILSNGPVNTTIILKKTNRYYYIKFF